MDQQLQSMNALISCEARSSEDLFEEVEEDLSGDYSKFVELRDALCECMFLEMLHCPDDQFLYKARSGLRWSDIVELSDPIKKKILLSLVENPQCFFVLFNTQRGKLKIIGTEIANWISTYPSDRVVSYLVVSNDKTLAEQSTNGLFSCFPKQNVNIFELSSNNKTSLREIKTYIDAYAYNKSYPMPLIVLLANSKQIEKLIDILIHIKNHENTSLKSGGGWDEADITYPQFRKKNFTVNGETTNFLNILNDPNGRIIRNGFVTATEGYLMDDEFEECYNALCHPVDIDPVEQEHYLSFHHPECHKNYITAGTKERNNIIAERILETNWDSHFNVPMILQDGTTYHHKIIINSDSSKYEMTNFAKKFSDKAYIMVFNMWGVTLYTSRNGGANRYPTRKQNLNRLLFYIYKNNHLNDKPLIILGRRKVDRGLGFHYAPRLLSQPITVIDGKDGILNTDGKEGLIWTDMCMGNKIEHLSTAIQKAGRGAGIIRQCPQYPGVFHYWIDETTAEHIESHYKKVDVVNGIPGSNSIFQAINYANAVIPANPQRNHDVDETIFRVVSCENEEETIKLTKEIITKVMKETFRKPQRDESGKFKTSLNTKSEVVTLLDAVKSVPTSYGTNSGSITYRRYLPSYIGNTLYCVIPLIDPGYKILNQIENGIF